MNSIIGAQLCADVAGKRIEPVIIDYLNNSMLDLSKNIPDPQQLVSADGLPVCTRENISVITGLPGSRKSFLCTAIAGAFVSKDGFLGLENPNDTGVLAWFDTEQATGHVARIGRRLHRIVGLPTDKNAENIQIFTLREYSFEDRRKIVEAGIELLRPDFVVIDGVADLIADPNSPSESSEIVSWLMSVSKNYASHILTVVHTNVGNDKARGHLGSEVMRKAETAMYVEADGEISKVRFKKTRDESPAEFSFCVKEGLPSLVTVDIKPNRQEARKRNAQEFFRALMKPGEAFSYSTMIALIKNKANVGDEAARKRLSYAAGEAGVLIKNKVGGYHLSGYPDPQQEELSL